MTILAVTVGKPPRAMKLDGSLKAMQNFVGGTIQALYPFEDAVGIVCNDEAKLIGLPYNRALRDENGNIYDIIAGDFFVCGLGEDNFCSLPENLIEKYTQLFAHPELFIRTGDELLVIPF